MIVGLALSVVLASEVPIAKDHARVQPVRFAVMTTNDHPECILLGRQVVVRKRPLKVAPLT